MKRQVDAASLHLYVTRSATLEYQRQVGGGFEAARRDLTLCLIDTVTSSDPVDALGHYYLMTVRREHGASFEMRAKIMREGPLLVVPFLERCKDAPAAV